MGGSRIALLVTIAALAVSVARSQDFPTVPRPVTTGSPPAVDDPDVTSADEAKRDRASPSAPIAPINAAPQVEPKPAAAEPDSASNTPPPDDDDRARADDSVAASEPAAEAKAPGPAPIAIDPDAANPLNPTAAAVAAARAARAALGEGAQPIELLGASVAPGTRAELRWQVGESFDGSVVETPVIVVNGAEPGLRVCLTAGVHGDELNGVEVVRRIVNDLDPQTLSGTVIAVPIVNLLGFARGSRYLPDRRDLNRFFPGFERGSAASRMAFSLFRRVIVHCDALVDFHTGSFDRSNLPQVRGDLRNPSVRAFTRSFGATPVLHSPGSRGMLRLAATDHAIPAVTFEVGAPYRLEPDKIDFAVQAVSTLLHQMGLSRDFRLWAEPQATFYESKWIRADQGGMLFSAVALGDRVRQNQRLGKIIDPIRNREYEITAPFAGRVIGMALNQVVLPGFAAYHLGVETSEARAAEDAVRIAPDVEPLETLEGDEFDETDANALRPRDESDPDSVE